MIPKTPLNKWILEKIVSYLTIKEGCVLNEEEFTHNGMKAVISDAFGYTYEVSIKTIGRVNDDTKDGLNDQINFAKNSVSFKYLDKIIGPRFGRT